MLRMIVLRSANHPQHRRQHSSNSGDLPCRPHLVRKAVRSSVGIVRRCRRRDRRPLCDSSRVRHFSRFLRSGSPNCWHCETPLYAAGGQILYLTHAHLGRTRREKQSPLCDQSGSRSHPCAKDAQEPALSGAEGTGYPPGAGCAGGHPPEHSFTRSV